ncbi:Defective in cullin neddylation protein [Entamoeba marina]
MSINKQQWLNEVKQSMIIQPVKRSIDNNLTCITYKTPQHESYDLYVTKYYNQLQLNLENVNEILSFYHFEPYSRLSLIFLYLNNFNGHSIAPQSIQSFVNKNLITTNNDLFNCVVSQDQYVHSDEHRTTLFYGWIFQCFSQQKRIKGTILLTLLHQLYRDYPLLQPFLQFLSLNNNELNRDQWVCLSVAKNELFSLIPTNECIYGASCLNSILKTLFIFV